jgi:hypothetical protein
MGRGEDIILFTSHLFMHGIQYQTKMHVQLSNYEEVLI